MLDREISSSSVFKVSPLLCYPEFVLFFEVPYSRDRWQPVFAHFVLLFALLLACRTPGTPVPCKAGLDWTPRMGGSATTGSYDTRPRAPGNPISPLFPVVRNIAARCLFVTPVQVARTRRFTHRTHVLFFFFFCVFRWNSCLCVTLPHSTHTYGQSRTLCSFLHKSPHARKSRVFRSSAHAL